MKALTFHAPHDVRLETVAEPRLEAAGDAIVELSASAVCGSDLHVYRGHERGLDAGTTLGHEFVGRVVELGSERGGLELGMSVVSPFSTSCGACFFCARGLSSRCERGALFGWVERGRGLPGAQAERVRVPLAASTLVAIPAGIPPEEALLAGDVLATGSFAADLAGVAAGTVVAVVGCGPVGLMAVVAAVERKAARVFAIDGVSERRALAKRLGAEPLGPGADEARAALEAATGGRGADCVIEAVGSAEASRLALDLVRAGGAIAAVGVHTEPRFAFSPGEAYDKSLTYRAGRCPARRYVEPALALIASRRHDLASIISHRLPLSDAVRAYDIFDRKLDGCTKVVLTL